MKVGIVNGCFDVLHIGHIELFKFANKHCDSLWVYIDSDEMVRESKGKDRPFNTQLERAKMLSAIRYVDHVRVFRSHDELIFLCKYRQADVHIVGEEYKGKEVIGACWASKLIYFEKVEGYSTTKILSNDNE